MSRLTDTNIKKSQHFLEHKRRHIRLFKVGILIFFLSGCAAQRLHDEGMNMVEEGKTEQGLDKLKQAVKSDPANFSYKIDLIRVRERVIDRILRSADSQRYAGNADEAEKLYQQVLKIDKDNARATAGLHNLVMDKRHNAAIANAKSLYERNLLNRAQSIVRGILLEDPDYKPAKDLNNKIEEQLAKDEIAGPSLKAEFKKPVTLEFRDANLKMVVEALSRTSGLNILLDKDVRGDLKTTIFVKDASVEDTVDLIALQNGLNKKILSDNTILLYPDNPAKTKEYQDLMIHSFQLTNADATEMEKMVKSLLKTHDMYVDKKTNSLVIRDTPDAIRLAGKLISAQDLAQPEVMLEVEVLEVTRARLTELGLKLPEQIALSASGTPPTTTVNTLPGGGVVTTTTPSQPLTLRDLGHLRSDYFKASSLDASIDLKDESGDVNILASPRIRVRNREKAKILIGDRVPVITNAITPVSTGTPVVTGNVQYLDVGLKLNVQPYIHPDNDVEIKVNLEVSNIVREISSGPTLAYQIGTRSANTVLRLKDGETQVLAGLISDEDRKAAQKFPGLGELPVLGRLFSSHKDDSKKTEIVLSITPHLTRRTQRPDARNVEFWSGTDSKLRSRPITLEPSETSKAGSPYTSNNKVGAQSAHATSIHKADTSTNNAKTGNFKSQVATQHSPNQAGGTVSLSWDAPPQAKVGDEFQLVVNAQSGRPLSGMSFTLNYDRNSLKIASMAEGDLFKQNGKRTIFTSKDNPDTGSAFLHVARVSPQGASGKGSVAIITFNVRAAAPKSPIVISNTRLVGSHGNNIPPPTEKPLFMKLIP